MTQLADILKQIRERSSITDEELDARIDKKLNELSGLISREGAAHIVANELGIKIAAPIKVFKIIDVKKGARCSEISGRVTRVFEMHEFRKGDTTGRVASFILGDETGTIRVTLWNEQASQVKILKEGTIVKIKGGYLRNNNGQNEIHLNDKASLVINPPDVSIAEVVKKRSMIKDLQEGELNVEIVGTIVQMFEPRFFEVCPQCNKKAVFSENKHQCTVHGVVEPKLSYVFNASIDDSTEIIRATFYKNQANRLFGRSDDEMLQLKVDPAKLEDYKNSLLGKSVKLVGRVQKNAMFDRVEFISQQVFEVNPVEEIKQVEEMIQEVS